MNGDASFRGTYTDGETARLVEVEVRLGPANLVILNPETNGMISEWPVGGLIVDNSVTDHTRVTCKGFGEAALGFEGPEFRRGLKRLKTGRDDRELSSRNRLYILLGVVAALILGGWWAMNPLSRLIARRIPFAWEQKAGAQFKKQFDGDRCEDEGALKAVEHLKERLVGKAPLPVEFEIVLSRDQMVNAFALPGGVIMLNRGLLRTAESADEVAGVLAHEMQHVIQRHITASLVRGAILTSLWQFSLGDFSGIIAVDPHTLYQIVALRFDRQTEADADRGAMGMLDAAHISRQGFVEFFTRMEKKGPNVPAIISTHPGNDDRIAMLKRNPGPKNTKPALSDDEWNTLHTACSDDDPPSP